MLSRTCAAIELYTARFSIKRASTRLPTLQSGLLAQKDSWTPCLGVLVQLVLNCACDVLLIGYFRQGLAGAAWATVFAQWAGTLVTLWSLPRGGRVSCSQSHSLGPRTPRERR